MGVGSGPGKDPVVCLLSGGLTGMLEISFTYPFEYAKTVLQLHPVSYKGMGEVFRLHIQKRNPQGLYRGFPIWLLYSYPRSACRYGTFHFTSRIFSYETFSGLTQMQKNLLAGITAGIVESVSCLTPMQNVSVQLTHDASLPAEERRYGRFWQGLRKIVKEQGVLRLHCNAVVPTTIKTVINQAIRFSMFHHMHAHYFKPDRLEVLQLLAFGGISGAVSAVISHPCDVVKAKLMGLHGHEYRSMFDCLHQVVRSEGILGLYNGLLPRLTRVCMEVAISFSLFETIYSQVDALTQ